MKYLLLGSIFLSFLTPNFSQKKPFVLGWVDTLYSESLQEKRVINIYLPDGYSPDSAKTYPVIYLLDGGADEDFIHIAGLVQFSSFSWVNHLPASIVVGIANTQRQRDFTHPPTADFQFPAALAAFQSTFKNAGGSGVFMDFLEKDLQPYIQEQYKTNGQKTLIGQSLAGLMAAEIVLKRPQLFSNFIIVSPSLWWDDGSLLKLKPGHPKENTQVYVAVGKEGAVMEKGARNLARILQQSGRFKKVFFQFRKKEDHGTILHPAVEQAFQLLQSK